MTALKTFLVDIENTPLAQERVASLLRRRHFALLSLTPAVIRDGARLTISIAADDATARRFAASLCKLRDVRRVADVTARKGVVLELALIKMCPDLGQRVMVLQLCEVFAARVADFSPESLVIAATGASDKIDDFIAALGPLGFVEATRTGQVAMTRGPAEAPGDARRPAAAIGHKHF